MSGKLPPAECSIIVCIVFSIGVHMFGGVGVASSGNSRPACIIVGVISMTVDETVGIIVAMIRMIGIMVSIGVGTIID